MAMNKRLQWRSDYGEPIRRGEVTVTPEARVLVVRLGPFGFTWNRPVAVHVDSNGTSERLAITDVTRLAQIAVMSAVFLTVAIVGLLGRR